MFSLIQSQPKVCSPLLACKKPRFSHSLQIRAHIPRDYEGRMVDANLEVLKLKIEQVRKKELLERCCVAEQGWNYEAYTNTNIHHHILQLLGMVASTLAFTILACTFGLCSISFLINNLC